MKRFSLEGKTAIVTGGNRGLGLGITKGYAEEGVTVVIMSYSDNVHKVAKEFREKGFKVYSVQVDLNEHEQIEPAFNKALELLGGRLDIIVNNAGIQRRHLAEEFPYKDWLDVINVNLNAVFTLSQLSGRVMLKQGSGKIINIASMLSYFASRTVPAYAASKGGIVQLTKALSNEWADKGIQVNAIAPGQMDTEMNEALTSDPELYQEYLKKIPAGRWGNIDDLAGTAIFLASSASDYVCGTTIPVDGGFLGL